MLSTYCAVPAGQRAGPSLARHEKARATENTRRRFRSWTRRRRCGGVRRQQRQRSAGRWWGPASPGAA